MSPDSKSGRPRWVLTIADDERLRETLTRGLNRHHFEVVAASSASDLQVLDRSPDAVEIDVVLLDVPAGPDPRALAVLQRLEGRGYLSRTLCLIAPRDSSTLSSRKVACTLLKPIDLAELALELGRVAREWAAPAEASTG